MDKKKILKLVVVGDSYVGKTTLLFAYTERQFRSVYSTTVFDNWSMTYYAQVPKSVLPEY
ncbi:hypothetical protein COOONC_19945 [Cooperia oncophora]